MYSDLGGIPLHLSVVASSREIIFHVCMTFHSTKAPLVPYISGTKGSTFQSAPGHGYFISDVDQTLVCERVHLAS